jgi:hypothetical protein
LIAVVPRREQKRAQEKNEPERRINLSFGMLQSGGELAAHAIDVADQ